MKKTMKLSAWLLAATIFFSSCIGSFQLTNKVLDWNNTISNKFVNELVFIAFHIIPVYECTMLVDAMVAEPGETKVVKNSQGQDVEITAMENGYSISNGETAMNLLFDEETQVWSAVYNDQVTELVKIVDNNNAQLFLMNGEVMDVTLDAEGINMARMYMNNSFAMAK